MSILILMIVSAIVVSLEEVIESICARIFQRRVKFQRPRQYKFN